MCCCVLSRLYSVIFRICRWKERKKTVEKEKGSLGRVGEKKEKVSTAKKAWEMRRETNTDGNHEASEESRKEPQPSTSKAKREYDDFLDRTAPKNMSELKLRNSSFKDLENEVRVSTRSQTSSSGMPQSIEEHEKAHGFKLQDAELLSHCISKSAICSSCKRIQNPNFSSPKKTLTVMALLKRCI